MAVIQDILSRIGLVDVLDILIVAYVFYKLFVLIQRTRAEQLVKGIILLLIVSKVSEYFEFNMIFFILRNTLTVGLLALLIIFQPELRRALEILGRNKILTKSISDAITEEIDQVVAELTDAILHLSRKKIGALIVIENEIGLNDIIETGTALDSKISADLLINIFTPKAPLHDGAIVIRNEKIMAAACLLPLTNDNSVSRELGTRHRAALGMIEVSDAMVIVVSEETGAISVARGDTLERFLDIKTLSERITTLYKGDKDVNKTIRKWWMKNE